MLDKPFWLFKKFKLKIMSDKIYDYVINFNESPDELEIVSLTPIDIVMELCGLTYEEIVKSDKFDLVCYEDCLKD